MLSRALLETVELSTPSWGEPHTPLPKREAPVDEPEPSIFVPAPTDAQRVILASLGAVRYMTVEQMCHALHLSRTVVNTHLRELLALHLVERKTQPREHYLRQRGGTGAYGWRRVERRVSR